MSLGDFVASQIAGDAIDDTVVVTFDDGYLDNLTNALPILERNDVPATVFVCTGCLQGDREMWWDQLERALILQQRGTSSRLEIELEKKSFFWDVEASVRKQDLGWNNKETYQFAVPQSQYLEIWQAIFSLAPEEQPEAMQQIRAWAGIPEKPRLSHMMMDEQDLLKLRSSKLVEIGAHTVSHPCLPAKDITVQRKEILQSKARLEQICEQRVNHFSYPFGAYEGESKRIVRDSGFLSACAAYGEAVNPKGCVFELPRLHVCNWDAEEFERKVRALIGGRSNRQQRRIQRAEHQGLINTPLH